MTEWADAHLSMLDSRTGGWDAAPETLRALDVDKSWCEIDIVMAHSGMPLIACVPLAVAAAIRYSRRPLGVAISEHAIGQGIFR